MDHFEDLLYFNFFSIAIIISLAISFPVAASIPSSPGEEFTSSSKVPLFYLIMSTPATAKLRILEAFIANRLSSAVIFTFLAEPPI